MSFVYLFGIFALGAYLLQILFGLKQIKHFNHNYQQLRKRQGSDWTQSWENKSRNDRFTCGRSSRNHS